MDILACRGKGPRINEKWKHIAEFTCRCCLTIPIAWTNTTWKESKRFVRAGRQHNNWNDGKPAQIAFIQEIEILPLRKPTKAHCIAALSVLLTCVDIEWLKPMVLQCDVVTCNMEMPGLLMIAIE